MEAPWKKYPNLWPSSKQWKVGPAADYLQEWLTFYKELDADKKHSYRKKHKAPFYWFEIYILHNEDLISWTMPTLFLVILSTPLRFLHFKLK